VHQQNECQPVVTANDSDTNEVADSSDVLQYVTASNQLPADDTQLVESTGEYADDWGNTLTELVQNVSSLQAVKFSVVFILVC